MKQKLLALVEALEKALYDEIPPNDPMVDLAKHSAAVDKAAKALVAGIKSAGVKEAQDIPLCPNCNGERELGPNHTAVCFHCGMAGPL